MDPLSYLAPTEQQLSFIIASEGRQGGAETCGGRRLAGGINERIRHYRRRVRVSGVVKVPTGRDAAAMLGLLTSKFVLLFTFPGGDVEGSEGFQGGGR